MLKAKYKIYPEQKLLVEIFYGTITIGDLQLFVTTQMKNKFFTSANKTFSDIRNVQMFITNEELDDYLKNLKGYMREMNLRWSILTDNPNKKVISLLLKSDVCFTEKVEIFGPLRMATSFLGINLTPNNLHEADYISIDG